jgi:3-hydroxyisobutyrate dehydrogenase-like beta-hydroxyacid dehydrogenase
VKPRRIALLGLGEVGTILADDLGEASGAEIAVVDVLFSDAESGPSRVLRARPQLQGHDSAAAAVRDAQLVISAVTAAAAVEAASAAADGMTRDAWYLDLNSVAPATRQHAATTITAAGGRYVEAAVMAPVPPRRLATPILLGGSHAQAFAPVAAALGFSGARAFSPELGRASAAKMCRSVVVKGMEALLGEALLTARHYGVEADVLASLADLMPVGDWSARARYMISRSLLHGARRAEEMEEVAKTVRGAGLAPHMSDAAARQQRFAGRHATFAEHELEPMLDGIRATLPVRDASQT